MNGGREGRRKGGRGEREGGREERIKEGGSGMEGGKVRGDLSGRDQEEEEEGQFKDDRASHAY